MKNVLTYSNFDRQSIVNIVTLARILDVECKKLEACIKYAEIKYSPINKLKKNGVDSRIIHAPDADLKLIQSKIYEKLLKPVVLPSCVYGHAKGKNIVDNATYHLNSKYLLNVDIIDFFPSIRYPKVKKLFGELVGDECVASELTKLTTYKNVLPQGSPASPYISALILNNLDKRISSLSSKIGIRYTRYFDDISFSATFDFSKFESSFIKIINSEGFAIHKSGNKFVKYGPTDIKKITGIEIHLNGQLSAGEPQELEDYVVALRDKGVDFFMFDNKLKEKEILQGRIAFFAQVNKNWGGKIMSVFKQISWES